MAKLKIRQGGYVRHYSNKEVYRVLEVHGKQATLIDAANRHVGLYPFDELKPVRSEKVKIVQKYEA